MPDALVPSNLEADDHAISSNLFLEVKGLQDWQDGQGGIVKQRWLKGRLRVKPLAADRRVQPVQFAPDNATWRQIQQWSPLMHVDLRMAKFVNGMSEWHLALVGPKEKARLLTCHYGKCWNRVHEENLWKKSLQFGEKTAYARFTISLCRFTISHDVLLMFLTFHLRQDQRLRALGMNLIDKRDRLVILVRCWTSPHWKWDGNMDLPSIALTFQRWTLQSYESSLVVPSSVLSSSLLNQSPRTEYLKRLNGPKCHRQVLAKVHHELERSHAKSDSARTFASFPRHMEFDIS